MQVTALDTPCVVIDMARVEANLRRAQDYADKAGLALRPHVKTHKLPQLARMQMALGAVGVTCQKLGEAEAMAAGGLTDIFIPYNILGAAKLDRLKALHDRITVAVTADSRTTINGYASRFGDAAHPLPVLVECDTGANRCGVQTVAEVLDLAQAIRAAPGLRFDGLMTYPPRGGQAASDQWLAGAVALLRSAGITVRVVSSGGTPDLFRAAGLTCATEYRPGTYIYSDRMQVSFGHGSFADCALQVHATVVSRPTRDRCVLDAGSKALAADLCLRPGHGHIPAYPAAIITSLSEEHAVVDLSACPDRPEIGQVVTVIPNHACVVTNLFDRVHLARDGVVIETAVVTSRGHLA